MEKMMSNLEKTREVLTTRLAVLSTKVDDLEDNLRTPRSSSWEDRATEIEGDEVLDALEESAVAEIVEIREALKRLEDGSYGICKACNAAIDPKRMHALPYATQCIQCAESNGWGGVTVDLE
jgi:DnaK suppressor protein